MAAFTCTDGNYFDFETKICKTCASKMVGCNKCLSNPDKDPKLEGVVTIFECKEC